MKKQVILAILALSFALSAAPLLHAQDLNIDDFQAGGSPILQYLSGVHLSTQTGPTNHIIGGTRSESVNANGNTLNQLSTFQFRPDVQNNQSAFIQNGGFYAGPRVDMQYGAGTPMREDLSSYKQNGFIRVNFKGLTEGLNFNIQLFTGTKWAQGGCNIGAYPAGFSVELPLSRFVDTGIDFTDVTYMNFIFQSGSAIGAVSFAVTSIEVSNTHKGGAISCHY